MKGPRKGALKECETRLQLFLSRWKVEAVKETQRPRIGNQTGHQKWDEVAKCGVC